MRMNYEAAAPDVMTAMIGLETYLARQSRREDGVDKPLMELVKIRVSQINGCAYCLDMHTKDARALGETEQRIYALSAWRETPFFSDRERAALAWAEANTLLPQGVSQQLFEEVRELVFRSPARQPDAGHRHHQRLEPLRRLLRAGAGQLPAGLMHGVPPGLLAGRLRFRAAVPGCPWHRSSEPAAPPAARAAGSCTAPGWAYAPP